MADSSELYDVEVLPEIVCFKRPPESNNLYLSNIPYWWSYAEIYRYLRRCGPIYELQIKHERRTHEPAYGFVKFFCHQSVSVALSLSRSGASIFRMRSARRKPGSKSDQVISTNEAAGSADCPASSNMSGQALLQPKLSVDKCLVLANGLLGFNAISYEFSVSNMDKGRQEPVVCEVKMHVHGLPQVIIGRSACSTSDAPWTQVRRLAWRSAMVECFSQVSLFLLRYKLITS